MAVFTEFFEWEKGFENGVRMKGLRNLVIG
jgi:hypothetical protein